MGLDCISQHSVYIYDRGGRTRLGEVTDIARVRWGRVRDDISEASMALAGASCNAQSVFLASIEPGRHEMVIFRAGIRVWEGPITRMTFTRTTVEIFARDVMHYAYRTIMRAGYSSAYPNVEYVIGRVKRIMIAELARKEALNPPINVVPYITDHQTSTDAKTARVTLPYQMTLFEHLDDIASKGGMDYTVIGRAIHLWDTSKPAMGMTATLTEADFLGDMYVSVYGMELATHAAATDGQGAFGLAGANDPYYGEYEILATAYDETTDGGTPPTTAELASQAQRNLAARNPTPIQVRVPDNSSLNPEGILTVADLVPGVHIPLIATLTARTVSQMQKLDKVQFEESSAGELITIMLFPAAKPDPEPV